MGKIIVFMMVSLDGFIEGPQHDLSWHVVDNEFNDFAIRQLKEAHSILFGRRTYQLMESFWPNESVRLDDPEVATLMNTIPKVVVSNSLKTVDETQYWKHIRLINTDVKDHLLKLKKDTGGNLLVLGSNNLCVSLLDWGLLDEVRLMINPVVIGKGTGLFTGIENKIEMKRTDSHLFDSGNVLLTYHPLQ